MNTNTTKENIQIKEKNKKTNMTCLQLDAAQFQIEIKIYFLESKLSVGLREKYVICSTSDT